MSKLFWDKFLTVEYKTISTQTDTKDTVVEDPKDIVVVDTKDTKDTKDPKDPKDTKSTLTNLLSMSKRLDELLECITHLKNKLPY